MNTRSILLFTAWLVAIIATLGSLYFSEVRMFVPCALCWWQRVLMYPLVLILGVATFREDYSAWRYAVPLSLTGLGISTYHYLLQKVPALTGPSSCATGVPCSGQYINWLGFITIPLLAGTAFLLISVLLLTGVQLGHGRAPARD